MTSESRLPEEVASAGELTPPGAESVRLPWIPESAHLSHGTGVHFDIIRIPGDRGAEVAEKLLAAAEGGAGPILVRTLSSAEDVLFVLPPGTAEPRRWPPGIFPHGTRRREYVAIPALRQSATMLPVRWESVPTVDRPYVDPEALFELVCRLTEWPGEPP
ncbi:hypothetical protein [Streptomyces noursei]|uniref:hypothetical protein n=1 Tax=Streptomyces noursei TaxID=1971 RepID=UPI0015E12F38|nr:hypothetical protein [Streptomyces noursei]